MRKLIMTAAGAGLLLLGAGVASAQNGGVCQLGPGNAILSAGTVDGDATPEAGKFGFVGSLSGPGGECAGLKVCAVGNLANASCAENQHNGTSKVCTACSLNCDNPATPAVEACSPSNIGVATINCSGQQASFTFQGVCVGANCSGGAAANPGLGYSLNFDVPTVQSAMANCGPTAPAGSSITNASFTGVLAWGGP